MDKRSCMVIPIVPEVFIDDWGRFLHFYTQIILLTDGEVRVCTSDEGYGYDNYYNCMVRLADGSMIFKPLSGSVSFISDDLIVSTSSGVLNVWYDDKLRTYKEYDNCVLVFQRNNDMLLVKHSNAYPINSDIKQLSRKEVMRYLV